MIATDGSLGSSETISNLSEIRLKETQKGLKEISSPIMLNIKDGHLGDDITHKKLLKEIFKHNPDLIVTHSESDYHPDLGHYQNSTIHCRNIYSNFILRQFYGY